MIKSLFTNFRSAIRSQAYQRFLPRQPNSSDVYIVEYPKSGITWLSTLIANINLIESKSKLTATYFNIQQLIPDIHMSRDISPRPLWEVPAYRFIKSHHEYCPSYEHVIYLVRNPVSVMNSYYQFRKERGLFDGTFMEFIQDKQVGINSWKRHVSSWLNKSRSQRMHIIKFENLRKDPVKELQYLYENLGVGVGELTIKQAVELSSLDSMKKSEALYKKYDPTRTVKFVKQGHAKAKSSEEAKSYILKESHELLDALGYDETAL